MNNPTTQTLTLTSSGTAAVTVNSVTVTGSGFSAIAGEPAGYAEPGTNDDGDADVQSIRGGLGDGATEHQQHLVDESNRDGGPERYRRSAPGRSELGRRLVDPAFQSPDTTYIAHQAGSSSFAVLNSMNTQTAYTDSSCHRADRATNYYVTSVDSSGVESAPSNKTTVAVP